MSKKLTFRLPDSTAAAFERKYPGRGERSLILQQVVERLIGQGAHKSTSSKSDSSGYEKNPLAFGPSGKRRSLKSGETVRVSVRLTPEQYLGVEAKAGKLGMATGPYIRALVDAQLGRNPQWPDSTRAELSAASSQLRKIGINLNQLVHMGHMALEDGKPFTVDTQEVEKVGKSVERLKASFQGVLTSRDSYWRLKVNRHE